jgi:hypothetical protein
MKFRYKDSDDKNTEIENANKKYRMVAKKVPNGFLWPKTRVGVEAPMLIILPNGSVFLHEWYENYSV